MKTDARVRYTKKVLRESLLYFLQFKSITEISVKEVCGRAEINRATFYKHYKDCCDLLEQIENQVLDMEQCPYEAQINLLVTDLDGIQEINKEFRNLDQPTDVLSFPAIPFTSESDFSIVEEQESDYFDPESGELLLGDIMICAQKVKEQAEKYNHSEMREFGFLVAHSMLHLCGYDHMEPEEAKVMEAKQEEVLAGLHITREER